MVHSFWVPQLAGKTDAIPGQTNETWMEAHRPGTYRGQCTEYCGVQHAHMGLLVIARDAGRFPRLVGSHNWQARAEWQRAGCRMYFEAHCGGCHAVRGTDAAGGWGPISAI